MLTVARITNKHELMLSGKLIEEIPMPDPVFERNSVSYLLDGTAIPVSQPCFTEGISRHGIFLSEGTVNIFPYSSSFEECYGEHVGNAEEGNTVTTEIGGGWAVSTHYNTATIRVVNDGGYHGTKSVMFIHDGSSGWKSLYTTSEWQAEAGKTYTISVWARANRESQEHFMSGYAFYSARRQLAFTWPDGTPLQNPGRWVRGVCTFSPDATDSGRVYLYGVSNGEDGLVLEYDAVMLEEKPYATVYHPDTRLDDVLSIPTENVLHPDEGSIEFWCKPLVLHSWNSFFHMPLKNGRFVLLFSTNGSGRFDFGPTNSGPMFSAGTVKPGAWNHIALRWSRKEGWQAVFINGMKFEQGFPAGEYTFPEFFVVVNNRCAIIDDLRISSRARSDEEIASLYHNMSPSQVDKDTTYKLTFDSVLTPSKSIEVTQFDAYGNLYTSDLIEQDEGLNIKYTVESDLIYETPKRFNTQLYLKEIIETNTL